jgi:hypothetical protein
MVTVFLRGGVFISGLVRLAQLEQSCYQQAFQEPYDGNRLQLHLVLYFIQKVVQNVLSNGHRRLEIWPRVLQSFG